MNSCLYQCEVMHHRLAPKNHTFSYRIFMFYIDLDEIDTLARKHLFFSRNKFNWFSLHDRDHFHTDKRSPKSIKENITTYLKSQHPTWQGNKVMLLTNAAIMGYVFNPISIYVCFDGNDKPFCAIAEVNNTHNEMKMYLLTKENLAERTFRKKVAKFFYVSPFAELDSYFDFIIKIPDENLNIRVDDYQQGKRFLLSALKGRQKKFSDLNLVYFGLRFPFVTLKIIVLIYWHAFLLMIKGIPYRKKNFNLHLQRDLYSTKKV